MSTSASAAPTNSKFLEEVTITLLNSSFVEKNKNPMFLGNYGERQIMNKEYCRLRQKYNNANRLRISTCLMKKTHDLEAYNFSDKLWAKPKPSPAVTEERPIRWTDYPRVMKRVAQGNETLIKQGLRRLGAAAIWRFEKQWAELDAEESALQAKKAQLASSSSS